MPPPNGLPVPPPPIVGVGPNGVAVESSGVEVKVENEVGEMEGEGLSVAPISMEGVGRLEALPPPPLPPPWWLGVNVGAKGVEVKRAEGVAQPGVKVAPGEGVTPMEGEAREVIVPPPPPGETLDESVPPPPPPTPPF